jgi:putative inorganic carbon (hco3(-)) transporter
LQEFMPNLLYAGVMFLLVTDRARLFAALGGVLAATLLLSLLTIPQVLLEIQTFNFFGLANGALDYIAGEVDAIRPTGPVYDPNYYCQILVPGFGLALGAALGGRTVWYRTAGLITTLVTVVAIMLTASRGGMLATGVVMVGLLLAYRKLHYMVVMSLPVIALLYLVPSYFDRVTSLTSSVIAIASGEAAQESSVSGRFAEMKAAVILFADHPVSGIGYGMFESRYQDISANYDMTLRGADRSAHSLYLETGAEQGLVGLLALLFLLGSSLRAVQLARRHAIRQSDIGLRNALTALAMGAVGLFASALFLHDAYAQHFWLVLALLFASEKATGLERTAYKSE